MESRAGRFTARGCGAILSPDGRWLPIGLGFGAVGLTQWVAALVGLPLFGDGAYYFFHVAVEGMPEIPNLRLAAVLPQIPALAATRLTDDVATLRHWFSAGFAALPFLSLLFCWLALRRDAPAIVLFPALFFAANQVNLSGVSELLGSLYLAWPFVVVATLRPERLWVRVYGLALAPLLVLLHPLAFGLIWCLSGLALLNARLHPTIRGPWLRIAGLLAGAGALRLLWTLLGANDYERSHGGASEAAYYFAAATPAQGLLMVLTLALGLATAVALRRRGRPRRSAAFDSALGLGVVLLPAVGVAVAGEMLLGEGIKLKAAAIYPLCLLLMGLAALSAAGAALGQSPGPSLGRLRWEGLFFACALTFTVVGLAKSVAWWTATHGLIDATGSSSALCIRFGPEEPYSLQWPWMAIVDDWAAPLNALVFRGPWPIPLLLPKDGCDRLERTGMAYLDTWIAYPLEVLEARFGPLRP